VRQGISGFEVPIAVVMKSSIFWDIMLRRPSKVTDNKAFYARRINSS
jgi:hypothetical protein